MLVGLFNLLFSIISNKKSLGENEGIFIIFKFLELIDFERIEVINVTS